MSPTEISAYAQAVESGQYARVTGLQGKYDHVRVFWEDQSLRLMLRPHLERLVKRRRAERRKLRVVDLGCGSGDGFETLMSLNRSDARWQDHAVELISPESLERYTGIELNPNLLAQARQRYRGQERARFVNADLREGLPFSPDEPAADVYLASFGTLSHFGEAETVSLLGESVRHANDGALVVADWLGRYAYEWTELWNADTTREQWMDYRISYIYPADERTAREIDSFSLRLLCADEARRVFRRVTEETRIRLAERALFDRSLFVGRHMDTADYNRHASPLRAHVNRLHEPLCRTDLAALLFELHLPDGFADARAVLEAAHASWNALVHFAADALSRLDAQAPPPEIPADAPAPARQAMTRLQRAIEASRCVETDDRRAAWFEPQLGLALRDIELTVQRGIGCGHGLVAIYEVCKGSD